MDAASRDGGCGRADRAGGVLVLARGAAARSSRAALDRSRPDRAVPRAIHDDGWTGALRLLHRRRSGDRDSGAGAQPMQLVVAHGMAAASLEHWDLQPLVVLPLFVTLVLYVLGLRRLWRRAGAGGGISQWSAASFFAGWLTTVVAVISPVAWLSEILFSVHMTQHTLLMLVAAPLLAFGQPLLAWLWAFDDTRREQVARPFRGAGVVTMWHHATSPLAVFLIQAAALWLWHIPSWYEAALHNDAIHAFEHVCLVLAGSLFWWAMVRGRYGRLGYGLAVVYVFLTAVHSGTLGALLTIAPDPWYGSYVRQARAWGIDPLDDQQLAGLLMWIPAGVIFIVLGLGLMAAWLGESGKRVRLGQAHSATRTLAVILAALILASACTSNKVEKE